MRRTISLFVALIVSATLIGLPASGQAQNKEREAKISRGVTMMLVSATVTDPFDRIISGLRPDNFEVYENGVQREIVQFSSEDGPVSIVIVLDTSGSMQGKLGPARIAAMNFIRSANPQDEFSLVYFENSRAVVATNGFINAEGLRSKLLTMSSQGRTPLIDAVYLALIQMRNAHKENRRAIVIISDGGDNHSRYNERDLKNLIKEADTQIYAVGIFEKLGYRTTQEERDGPAFLAEITEMTGGRAFTIDSAVNLDDVVSKIGTELRNQYLLGYVPNANEWNKDKKGGDDWRKIKVKIRPPRGLPPLVVRAKSGYYAPGFAHVK